jgi:tetratricopeptide (TPR) repeat protein
MTDEIQNLIASGNCKDALKKLEQNSNSVSKRDFYYFKAVCHRYLKEPDKALITLDQLIKYFPHYARAYQELGYIYSIQKNDKKALRAFLRAVRLNDSLHASWLSILKFAEGNEQLLAMCDTNIYYLKNLPPELKTVLSYINEGKLAKADHICRDYLQRTPHDVEAMRLLAKIALELYIFEDAEFLLESCLVFDPENIKVKHDYITVLLRRQKYGLALDTAKDLYNSNPEELVAMKLYATTLFRADMYDEAINLYQSILEKEPSNTDVMLSMGHLYKTAGQIDKSIASYQNAFKRDKYFGDSYWSLANLKTYKFTDEEIKSLHEMVKDEYVPDDEKVFMYFSLGKAYEDMGEYKKSFKYYKSGNNYQKANSGYSREDFSEECKNQISVCNKDLFDTKKDWGHDAKDPIFILGLPRAGSTLTEQILASHSMVEGTHELPNILAIAHKLNLRKAQDEESRYPDILLSLSEPHLKLIGENYINDSEVFRSGKPYFIDKMPNNFRHIGLINLILPNAKIIDIRRNSMAGCFSCYKQLFAEGQEFTYGLEDLASYYNDYVELMDHWNKVLPGKILSLQYEDLVGDLENSVRKILDYCELPFEQDCVEFYKSKRAVKTPSAEQVRQPIFKEGLDYWKNYEPYLTKLSKNLKY